MEAGKPDLWQRLNKIKLDLIAFACHAELLGKHQYAAWADTTIPQLDTLLIQERRSQDGTQTQAPSPAMEP